MIGQVIGYRDFVGGTRRPIYEDAHGQYGLDDDGERTKPRKMATTNTPR